MSNTTASSPTWDRLLREAVFGASARAIAGYGSHHPHDPADLLRCVAHCQRSGVSVEHMATKSTEWARLVPEWDRLITLLRHEIETRTDDKAPQTYREMKRVVHAGTDCAACDATGRADECPKCHGTGRRCGGRCRACFGFGGNYCRPCRGQGFTSEDRR